MFVISIISCFWDPYTYSIDLKNCCDFDILTPRVHAEPREALLRSVISASGVSLPGLTSSFYVRLSLLQIPQTPPVSCAPCAFPLGSFASAHSIHAIAIHPFIRAIGGIANVRTDEQGELKHTNSRSDHFHTPTLTSLP